jgi:ParB-like chromosome segregation protein Spo0J
LTLASLFVLLAVDVLVLVVLQEAQRPADSSEEQQPFLRGDSHPSKNINHRASRVKREWQDRDSEAG